MVRACRSSSTTSSARPPAADPLRQPARTSGRPTPSRATSARAPAASPKPTSAASCCRLPGRSRRPTTCSVTSSCTPSSTTSPAPTRAPGTAGALALPLWFIEGMAEYLSIGPGRSAHRDVDARGARREKLPTSTSSTTRKYFPYRYGQALWAFIGGKWGDGAIGEHAARRRRPRDVRDGDQAVLGVDTTRSCQRVAPGRVRGVPADRGGDEDAGVVRAASADRKGKPAASSTSAPS